MAGHVGKWMPVTRRQLSARIRVHTRAPGGKRERGVAWFGGAIHHSRFLLLRTLELKLRCRVLVATSALKQPHQECNV